MGLNDQAFEQGIILFKVPFPRPIIVACHLILNILKLNKVYRSWTDHRKTKRTARVTTSDCPLLWCPRQESDLRHQD